MEMESVVRNYSPVLTRATKGKMAAFKAPNWVWLVPEQSSYAAPQT